MITVLGTGPGHREREFLQTTVEEARRPSRCFSLARDPQAGLMTMFGGRFLRRVCENPSMYVQMGFTMSA
jgi:hypothetical protein